MNEIAGCTGKKQARKQGEEESYHGRTNFFLLRYFYFLNGGYFRYFIKLLGVPAILLGAPSNSLGVILLIEHKGVVAAISSEKSQGGAEWLMQVQKEHLLPR